MEDLFDSSVEESFKIDIKVSDVFYFCRISGDEFIAASKSGLVRFNSKMVIAKVGLEICAAVLSRENRIVYCVRANDCRLMAYAIDDFGIPRIDGMNLGQTGVFHALWSRTGVLVTVGNDIRVWNATNGGLSFRARSVVKLNFYMALVKSICVDELLERLIFPTERGFESYDFDGHQRGLVSDIAAIAGVPAVIDNLRNRFIAVHEECGIVIWDEAGKKLATYDYEQRIDNVFVLSSGAVALMRRSDIIVMDMTSGKTRKYLETGERGKRDYVGFSDDGSVVCLSMNGVFSVFETQGRHRIVEPAYPRKERKSRSDRKSGAKRCDRPTSPIGFPDEVIDAELTKILGREILPPVSPKLEGCKENADKLGAHKTELPRLMTPRKQGSEVASPRVSPPRVSSPLDNPIPVIAMQPVPPPKVCAAHFIDLNQSIHPGKQTHNVPRLELPSINRPRPQIQHCPVTCRTRVPLPVHSPRKQPERSSGNTITSWAAHKVDLNDMLLRPIPSARPTNAPRQPEMMSARPVVKNPRFSRRPRVRAQGGWRFDG